MARQSKFTAAFKAKVAVEALREIEPLESLAKKHGVAPSKITEWKNELLNNADKAFGKNSQSKSELRKVTAEKDRLLKKVGQLTIDCDFFCESLRGCRTQSEIADLEMKRPAGMSRNKFCKYMKFNRSNLYYKPKGESALNLRIMEIIDAYYLDHPTTGVKTMTMVLREKDYSVNEKRVRRLMRKMNLMAIYPRKCLSKGGKPKYLHPYLLRNLEITHRNQVWSTDISYIRMIGGFMYLYAIIDVYSRYIVGWKLSNTLSADNVHEMVKESIRKFGAPEIINTDQGSQYTTKVWKDLLKENGILISMDGRGRCKDNIWIERFWRTVKQEYVYINPTDSVVELRQGTSDYIEFYNYERPHQSIGEVLPARSYGLIA